MSALPRIILIQPGNGTIFHWNSGSDVFRPSEEDQQNPRGDDWTIRWYKDPSQSQSSINRTCGFEITSAHAKDHGQWKVEVDFVTLVDNLQFDNILIDVIIAKAPTTIRLGKIVILRNNVKNF